MFRSDDGVSRRTFLKAGAVAATAFGMTDLLGGSVMASEPAIRANEDVQAAPLEQGMTIVDAHCHATPIWYNDIGALLFEMDRNNVEHAMLVQIGGFFDNEYQFKAVADHPGRFGNVVLADWSNPDAVQTLERLAERGISGVRINGSVRSPGDDPFAIWKAAARLGLSITSGGQSADFASEEFAQILQTIPEVPVVLEHLASVNNPTGDPNQTSMRETVFALSRFPNAHIKIHGLGEFATRTPILTEPFPFVQPIPPAFEMAFDAFGPQRMMWGSDFPLVNSREGYPFALKLAMDQFKDKSEEDRAWIFGKTALKVFPIKG
jgi:L-fuconolactonase